jgi:hypothetical protein
MSNDEQPKLSKTCLDALDQAWQNAGFMKSIRHQDVLDELASMGVYVGDGYVSFADDSEDLYERSLPLLSVVCDGPYKAYIGISPSDWD